jgi:hypothetical protein
MFSRSQLKLDQYQFFFITSVSYYTAYELFLDILEFICFTSLLDYLLFILAWHVQVKYTLQSFNISESRIKFYSSSDVYFGTFLELPNFIGYL